MDSQMLRTRPPVCFGAVVVVVRLTAQLPRAQDGLSTWTNRALACIDCNLKKADRTPAQAQMKLRKEPVRQLASRAASHNILDFCARVPARKAELGLGSHSESRAGTANRCLPG